ncbi:DUF6504 family protein [Nonomuraea sp. KM90]|uniref:DUF6504 family protein n=1 Tax=Nonomuraea sp. KM90 TaxID=3457428 RepID=UPI003FCE9F5F
MGEQQVEVVTAEDDNPAFPLGRPVTFTWTRRGGRARTYRVEEVLQAWATTRQWWRDDLPFKAPLDIWHYRLQARSQHGGGVLVLSLDVARQRWSLQKFEAG